MASPQAIVQRNDVNNLTADLEARTKELRELEEEVEELEAAVRRANEEQALLTELHAINKITLRKMGNDDTRANRTKITDDTLQRILQLESLIKFASKTTDDLQSKNHFCQTQLDALVTNLEEEDAKIAYVKDVTGWDGKFGRYVHQGDNLKQLQLTLNELEEQQITARNTTTGLTKRIEHLTRELEKVRRVDEEILSAKEMLREKAAEYAKLEATKQFNSRVAARKEKLLTTASKSDGDFKAIKILEGDKRALHNDVLKVINSKKSNERSILSQDMRLRQLEGRLEAITGFLKEAFEGEDDSAEHRPGVEEGAKSVPLALFEEVQQDLIKARRSIVLHDERLTSLDAAIEINEKRANVLHYAIVARTAHAEKGNQEKEKDRALWMHQADVMQREFEAEYERLTAENEKLAKKLDRATSA